MTQLYSIDTVILFIVTLYLLYKFLNRNFDYWKRRGVPYLKPRILFGNYYDIMMFKKPIGHKLAEMYNEIAGPYFGMWVFNQPHFVVKSPELVKQILVKDFKYFQDRTIAANETADALSASMLFVIKSPTWKPLRNKMTPAFTSGKIKCMIPLINKVAEDLTAYLSKLAVQQDSIEAKEVCAKYSTDVITSCAFGVEGHSFENDKAPWRSVGRDVFDFTLANGIRSTSYFFVPTFVNLFKIKFVPSHVNAFLSKAFWTTIEHRKANNSFRNDLIDIMINMEKEGVFDELDLRK